MDQKTVSEALSSLCDELQKNNRIDAHDFEKYGVKRGLRNADGSGVLAGLTHICSVQGYFINDAERTPMDGHLYYRGIDIADIVDGCEREDRFSFEETCWLLLFGNLPTQNQLDNVLLHQAPPQPAAGGMPKGLQSQTLSRLEAYLKENPQQGHTCDDIASHVGLSVVTVRRYMNYLAEQHIVDSEMDYNTGGRPCIVYKLK